MVFHQICMVLLWHLKDEEYTRTLSISSVRLIRQETHLQKFTAKQADGIKIDAAPDMIKYI